jgi:hypothetical protein
VDDAALIKAVRLAARIADTHPDYTDDRIRQELTDALRTVFAEPIKSTGNGYGQQLLETPIISGREVYRIPPRSMVGGLVTVEAIEPGGDIRQMQEVTQREHAEQSQDPGDPLGFVDNADQLRLVPRPEPSGWTLRQWYKLRPSIIVEAQTKGIVTQITPTIKINLVPDDQINSIQLNDGEDVDIVAPNGSHELHLVQTPAVYTLDVTFPVGTDTTRIEVGDLLRAADQAEFPTMLPQEFHRTLADAAATVILSDMGTVQKAAALAAKVQADIARMVEAMEPRVRDLATPFKPRYGVLRAFRRWSPPARL